MRIARPPIGGSETRDNSSNSLLLTDISHDAHQTLKTRPARTSILQRSNGTAEVWGRRAPGGTNLKRDHAAPPSERAEAA
jgi:hypothetical protein